MGKIDSLQLWASNNDIFCSLSVITTFIMARKFYYSNVSLLNYSLLVIPYFSLSPPSCFPPPPSPLPPPPIVLFSSPLIELLLFPRRYNTPPVTPLFVLSLPLYISFSLLLPSLQSAINRLSTLLSSSVLFQTLNATDACARNFLQKFPFDKKNILSFSRKKRK